MIKIQNLRSNFSKKLFEGKTPLQVEDIRNLRGEIPCMISPVLKDYSNHLEDLVKMSQPIYYRYICMNSRLTDQVKQLMADVSAACQTLAKISSSAGELQKLHESFNSSVKSHKLTSMSEVYNALNQSMSSMGMLNLIYRSCLAKTNRPAKL